LKKLLLALGQIPLRQVSVSRCNRERKKKEKENQLWVVFFKGGPLPLACTQEGEGKDIYYDAIEIMGSLSATFIIGEGYVL